MKNKSTFDRNCHIIGWSLFIISSLFYMAASIRAGDTIGLLGGLFFFAACLIFLLPFISHRDSLGMSDKLSKDR